MSIITTIFSTLFIVSSPMLMSFYPLILITFLMFLNPKTNSILNSWMFADSSSHSLLLLTMIMTSLILLSSFTPLNTTPLIISISFFLILVFELNDPILFYISFELTLIPTFMLILLYGKQPERLQASLYILLYTILASLPLLVSIIMQLPNCFSFFTSINIQMMFGIFFTLAFLVKMPMFLTHLWLPKAHVEAPLEGSMVLAAVLLKLGGYGLIRLSPSIYKSFIMMNPWILSISLLGAFYTSMNCIRQKDLKALVAYSSVAHMSLVICAIFSLKKSAPTTAMLMMISHGLSSSALFFIVTIMYNSHHTRNTLAFKGLINTAPNLSFWWFILIAANIAAPPSISFFSEILIFSNIINWQQSTLLLIMITSMTTASFSFLIFTTINHSTPNAFSPSSPPKHKTFNSLFNHSAPLLLLTLKMNTLFY